jgi:uracil-DNA glycosylase
MMTREDILRELELLPVWTLRNPPELQALQLEPAVVETKAQIESEPIIEPVIVAEVNHVAMEAHLDKAVAVEKTVKSWAFVCTVSAAQADECALLMNNIIQATHLGLDDYVLLPDVQALNNYQVADVFLFGFDAAQSFLQMNAESLRGKAHTVDDVRYWVSYHPEQMLQNPMLKREVWRDMQMAMPSLRK